MKGVCPEDEYRDGLLRQCIPCKEMCDRYVRKACITFCDSVKCNQVPGFHYDRLLRQCFNCSDLCGQHPRQCSSTCNKITVTTSSLKDAMAPNPSNSNQYHMVVTCSLLGLCIIFCVLLVVLAYLMNRRRREHSKCKPSPNGQTSNGSSKEHLVKSGSTGEGNIRTRTPEPVETCNFCFQEQKPLKEGHISIQNPRLHLSNMPVSPMKLIKSEMNCVPVPCSDHKDSSFKIICCPSQDKPFIP